MRFTLKNGESRGIDFDFLNKNLYVSFPDEIKSVIYKAVKDEININVFVYGNVIKLIIEGVKENDG